MVAAKLRTFLCTPNKTLLALPPVAGTLTRGLTHTMKKQYLNFDDLEQCDKEFFINDSWCDYCDEADLGITEPNIYILDEKQYLEGNCKVCGNKQTTEVVVTYLNS